MLGRIALGRRAGARVWRLGAEPDAPWVASRGPRHAHLDGFDLHADLRVRGEDHDRLEQLCRYLLRPPVAHLLACLGNDKGEWLYRPASEQPPLPTRKPTPAPTCVAGQPAASL